MTVNVSELRAVLRALADAAAQDSKRARTAGLFEDAEFHAGRQAGLVCALGQLKDFENEAARERDKAQRVLRDSYLRELSLDSVGGAFDGVGTVYSDADEGL